MIAFFQTAIRTYSAIHIAKAIRSYHMRAAKASHWLSEMDRRRMVQPRPHATYQPDLQPVAVAEEGRIEEGPVCRAAYRVAVHLINLDHPGTASRLVAFFLQLVLRKPLGALHVVVRAQPLHQRIQVL